MQPSPLQHWVRSTRCESRQARGHAKGHAADITSCTVRPDAGACRSCCPRVNALVQRSLRSGRSGNLIRAALCDEKHISFEAGRRRGRAALRVRWHLAAPLAKNVPLRPGARAVHLVRLVLFRRLSGTTYTRQRNSTPCCLPRLALPWACTPDNTSQGTRTSSVAFCSRSPGVHGPSSEPGAYHAGLRWWTLHSGLRCPCCPCKLRPSRPSKRHARLRPLHASGATL